MVEPTREQFWKVMHAAAAIDDQVRQLHFMILCLETFSHLDTVDDVMLADMCVHYRRVVEQRKPRSTL